MCTFNLKNGVVVSKPNCDVKRCRFDPGKMVYFPSKMSSEELQREIEEATRQLSGDLKEGFKRNLGT
jgi:hypothetical protein